MPVAQRLGMAEGDLLDAGHSAELMVSARAGAASRSTPSPVTSRFGLETLKWQPRIG